MTNGKTNSKFKKQINIFYNCDFNNYKNSPVLK